MSKTHTRRRNRKKTKSLELLGDRIWLAITFERVVRMEITKAQWHMLNTNETMRRLCFEQNIMPVGGASFERHVAKLWLKRDFDELLRLANVTADSADVR